MLNNAYSFGWQGNILAIKQNNTIVGTFGSTFSSFTTDPVYIVVKANVEAQIVPYNYSGILTTRQVAFTIKAPNGTIIYQRLSLNFWYYYYNQE